MGLMLILTPSPDGVGVSFPFLVYAAPNALFPLISLFLWRHFSVHRSYIFIYMAGKSVAIAALAGWFLFSFPVVTFDRISLGVMVILAAGDVSSFLGSLLLRNRLRDAETSGEASGAFTSLAEIAGEPRVRAGTLGPVKAGDPAEGGENSREGGF
jgi:hypothetical protein